MNSKSRPKGSQFHTKAVKYNYQHLTAINLLTTINISAIGIPAIDIPAIDVPAIDVQPYQRSGIDVQAIDVNAKDTKGGMPIVRSFLVCLFQIVSHFYEFAKTLNGIW